MGADRYPVRALLDDLFIRERGDSSSFSFSLPSSSYHPPPPHPRLERAATVAWDKLLQTPQSRSKSIFCLVAAAPAAAAVFGPDPISVSSFFIHAVLLAFVRAQVSEIM